jgi:hypothetical protein
MAIRSRLKQKIKAILGTSSNQAAETTISPPQESNKDNNANTVAESTVEKVATSSNENLVVNSKPEDKGSKTADAEDNKTIDEEEKKKKVSEEKIRKHLLRTKKGLLKFIQKQGGTTDLGALNHHSEIRFLIGHQKFSEMMEDLVAEELIIYDWNAQEAMITEKGIQFSSN